MDAVLAALRAANVPGGTLEEVALIDRGDRMKPNSITPAVYATPQTMRPNQDTTTHNYRFNLPVQVGVMIHSNIEGEEGYETAENLLDRCIHELVKGRLNVSYSYQPRIQEYTGSIPSYREKDYYGAKAVIVVPFESTERL